MTRLTNHELITINARLAAEKEQLLHQVAQLKADIERITSVASAVNSMRPRTVEPTTEARRLAMAAAKELAQRSGRSIKVCV